MFCIESCMVNTNYLAYFLGTWLYKGGDDAKSDTTMNIVENLFVAHDECWWQMAFRIRSFRRNCLVRTPAIIGYDLMYWPLLIMWVVLEKVNSNYSLLPCAPFIISEALCHIEYDLPYSSWLGMLDTFTKHAYNKLTRRLVFNNESCWYFKLNYLVSRPTWC